MEQHQTSAIQINASAPRDQKSCALFWRLAFLIGGWGCLLFAFVGMFLPVLPTAPFVVAASFCFGYSNPRMRTWLEETEYFGELIRSYRTKEGISPKTFWRAIAWLYLTIGVSLCITSKLHVQIILLSVAFFVTVHLKMLVKKQ